MYQYHTIGRYQALTALRFFPPQVPPPPLSHAESSPFVYSTVTKQPLGFWQWPSAAGFRLAHPPLFEFFVYHLHPPSGALLQRRRPC